MADAAAAAAALLAPASSPPPADTLISDATPAAAAAAAKTPNLPDTPASADPETPFSDIAPADASDADASGVVAPADAHVSSDVIAEAPDADDDPLPALKHMTFTATAQPSKKSKKKNSNSVWTRPASRKGKKKGKQPANALAGGSGGGAAGRLPKPSSGEDEFVLAPAPRLAIERSDDSPDWPVLLSRIFKSDKIEVSDDRLTAGSIKGYRMVRATRGVVSGVWYFEVKVLHLGTSGHTRLGWATNNADIHAPVGFDGFGFGYRDMDGCKVYKALRTKYADEGYGEGDVLGFYINLPDGELYEPKQPFLVQYKGLPFRAEAPKPTEKKMPEPEPVPGSEICYFKNGVCQGTAFLGIPGGRYYPAASMYTLPDEPNCEVRFNFGPDFEFFPEDFEGRPIPQPMSDVPYQALEMVNEGAAENGTAEKTI